MRIAQTLFFFIIMSYTSRIFAVSDFYIQHDGDCQPIKLFNDQKAFESISLPYKDAKVLCNSKDPFAQGKKYTVDVDKETHLDMIHFDRNSDTLMVLGYAACASKIRWKYIVQFFKDYDIVMFDYRWKEAGFKMKGSSVLHPIKSYFLDERHDVVAVVQKAKTLKNYKNIIGLSECYSGLIFTMAQADEATKGNSLFTKLILDSTFVSLHAISNSKLKDPTLFCKTCSDNSCSPCLWTQYLFLFFSNVIFPDISIHSFMAQIHIPVLFIHGKEDSSIPLEAFYREAWNECQSEKVLFLTPYDHVKSWTDWGVYSLICNQFIQAPSLDTFINHVTSI